MIKEIVQYAGPYRLKNLKTMRTMDGLAWNASLYCDGKKLGAVEDAGYGGPLRFSCPGVDLGPLKAYAAEKTGETFEPEGMFLAVLADYAESITRAKRANSKSPVVIYDDELDENGVPRSYAQIRCKNTPQNIAAIKQKRPGVRLLEDELHLW